MFKKIVSVTLCVIILVLSSAILTSAKGKSFYANKTKISITKSATVTITSTTRASLKYTISKSKICSAKWGKWSGNKIKLYLKAKNSGKTNITVKNSKTNEKLTLKVTVKLSKTKKISLSKTKLKLTEGKKATLKCTVKPSSASKKIKWTSSNSNIVTVKNGKVSAKNSGIATVTAATTDGTKLKAKCTVYVNNKNADSKVKENLSAVKKHILKNGEKSRGGDFGIFDSYYDDASDDSASIIYDSKDDMLVFTYYSEYSDEPDEYKISSSFSFKYSLSGYDYVTANHVNVYYESNGNPSASYSAEIKIKTAGYNPDSTAPDVKVTSNTYTLSKDKIVQYVTTDFNLGLKCFDSLLYKELNMSLSDIGFKSYS